MSTSLVDLRGVEIENIVGRSPAMQVVYEIIGKVAPGDCTVLILGPSGSGKELVARAIHDLSPRRNRPLVTIHCGAFPENLLESELFGHCWGGGFYRCHPGPHGTLRAGRRRDGVPGRGG